jgi:hypothetical protein
MMMTSSSDPLEVGVKMPIDDSPAAIEILWTQMRPSRERGILVSLREHQVSWDWRWQWRSLRWRGWRLRRTMGTWVRRRRYTTPGIPTTDPKVLELQD